MGVALITGAGRGLALAVARGLAADGYHLALNVRSSREHAAALAAELAPQGVRVDLIPGDMAVEAEARAAVRRVLAQCGRLDVLVHAVGPYNFTAHRLVDGDDDAWRTYLDGNLSSLFWVCQEAVPAMRRQRYGRVIAFGCDGADEAAGWPGHAAYMAAKAGVVSLIRSLALEEAGHGITCHAIAPGDIPRRAKEWAADNPHLAGLPPAPVGRSGAGGDIARLVRFLCQPGSEFLTGTVTPVNGALPVRAALMVDWLQRQGLGPPRHLLGGPDMGNSDGAGDPDADDPDA